ncbi:hypothetical protein V5799_021893 [Amblyomma americanum]|uniref:Uncharacterized protein n=1 Tax=Amblyomma americanum TaxID=6943 RepID=A0AAQ4FM87_AMBAM
MKYFLTFYFYLQKKNLADDARTDWGATALPFKALILINLGLGNMSQPGAAGGQPGADQEAPRAVNPQHQAASKRIQQTQAQVDEVRR